MKIVSYLVHFQYSISKELANPLAVIRNIPARLYQSWLIDLVTAWMNDWLIDCLTDWLSYWLTVLLINCLIVLLKNWLSNWLTFGMNDWLTDWLSDWLTEWPTNPVDWLTHPLINCMTHGKTNNGKDAVTASINTECYRFREKLQNILMLFG